ncbi:MAG: radical SAM protein [bacterium]
MGYISKIRSSFFGWVINSLLIQLARASDERIMTLLKLARRIPRDPSDINAYGIDAVIRLFERRHPSLEAAKRIITQANPTVRKKVVQNWIIHALLEGQNKRIEFASKYGWIPPTFPVISLTMRCNLRCYGCYAGMYSQKRDALSTALVNRILSECKELGMHFVVLSGGEPFIRRDIFDIFREHGDVGFQVYTHGGLLDGDCVRRLAELGNVMPCISLEGLEAETDARRGRGHFRRVMAAMDRLREAGVLFGFSVTSLHDTVETICSERFIDLMIEKGCILGWYFTYIPTGRGADLSLMPTPEQRAWQLRQVSKLRNTKPILLADFWNDGWLTAGCLAGGRSYFHINADGNVEPCVFAHFAQDNIKGKSVKEVLDSPFFRQIRSCIPYSDNYYRPCMIIDTPHILRDAVKETGAFPTHPGAEAIITDFAPALDRYAEQWRVHADAAWEKIKDRIPARNPLSHLQVKV